MQVDGIWRMIDEEELRTIVFDTSIKLRGLYDQVYKKLQVSRKDFTLKLSYLPISKQIKWPIELNNDDDVDAFMLGQTDQKIATIIAKILQVSKEDEDNVNEERVKRIVLFLIMTKCIYGMICFWIDLT